MKRVMCLYRVSTKQQVNVEDDIPVQRRECMDFIAKHPDWVFLDERLEKGVSGFKVSANKRDAILEIKAMAERREFEILLVFMFDRLGRREDETPFLVEWFINHGVEVWSTREGQQRIDNRGDKLLNYIRYWMAGGESEKTSMRVKAAQTQMVEDGLWRGGKIPYGYKLVQNGRIGKRNRQLYDVEIDPEQAEIVKDIFKMVGHEGLGTLQVANILNKKYPDSKVWTPQTIRSMVKNPTYTGRFHMNDTMSEPQDHLRLISDSEFSFVHYAMQKRIPQHARLVIKENGDIGNTRVPPSEHSARLLTGLLYCANCGARLSGSYSSKKTRTGTRYRPVYRCFTGNVKARKDENEKQVYTAEHIENAVLSVVHRYFEDFIGLSEDEQKKNGKATIASQFEKKQKSLEAELNRLKKQDTKLKGEILKVISGDSPFDSQMLQNLITENNAAIETTERKLDALRQERSKEAERLASLSDYCDSVQMWAKDFDEADVETKKMILAHLIEKITVDKDYNLNIKFFITRDEFHWGEDSGKITVSEADSFMTA